MVFEQWCDNYNEKFYEKVKQLIIKETETILIRVKDYHEITNKYSEKKQKII